jgi:hypothetical protein
VRPRLRRWIGAAGTACLTVSAFCFASDTALRAAPLLAVRLHLPFAAPRIAIDVPAPPVAAQSPSPAPASLVSPPPHRRGVLGDGPIVLRGDGTYQLGVNRGSRNGLAQSLDNYSTALTMGAERRTEQTSLSVTSAFGYGVGGLSSGSLIAGYRTPKYGLSYGQVTGPSDSQLQIGGFARGIGLGVPLHNGDLNLLAATTTQADRTTYRVYGIRRNWNALGGAFSAGGYLGAAEQGGGRQTIADFGFRRYGAMLSTQTEVALSSTRGVGDVLDGTHIATAFQADLQGKSTFTTFNVHYDPAGFQTLTGAIDPGLTAELAVRRHSDRFGDLDLSLGHTDERIDSDVQHDDRATLSGGKSWAHAGVQYLVGLEGTRFAGGTTLNRTAAVTLTQSVRNLSLFETYQQASVSGSSGDAHQSQFTLGVSRPLLGGSAAVQFSRNASSSGGSEGASVAQSVSYRRSVGRKADVQFTQAIQTSFNNGVPTREMDSGISLVRRLSNVVAVQISADVFHQTGLGGGHGSSISASLVGPFGFGQPRDGYGHANPKLPAVIRGLVSYSASSTPFAYSASPIRGYNNALVVLDGRISQRTDSTGAFEFRFVSQGTHTIRIDPATIAPGLVSDREYATLKVLGGQTASVQFNVGNFAGVAGSVIATDSSGVKHGLPDVGISVDGIQAVTTTPDGRYQVGRLSPGAHTIQIVDATVPSTVAFTGERKRTITVTPGITTPLDFVAAPLGSIAGLVQAPADGGFGALVGLKNVYVVAEPGEHAVITDDDGSFILANLPAATYTLTVDPDTIPDGLSVLSGPDGPLSLGGGSTVSGIVFKLGAGAKEVVYTYSDGRRVPLQITTEPAVVPPGALLRVVARTAAKDVKDLAVESDVFGGFPLHLDARGTWVGTVVVPNLVKGDYALSVTAHRKDVTDGSSLVPVDPRIPLFTALLSPRNPEAGHTVRVTLRTLAPVAEGDAVVFEDGYKILLPKPSGRLFAFDIRLWRKGLPYNASVVTKRGQSYSISLR